MSFMLVPSAARAGKRQLVTCSIAMLLHAHDRRDDAHAKREIDQGRDQGEADLEQPGLGNADQREPGRTAFAQDAAMLPQACNADRRHGGSQAGTRPVRARPDRSGDRAAVSKERPIVSLIYLSPQSDYILIKRIAGDKNGC